MWAAINPKRILLFLLLPLVLLGCGKEEGRSSVELGTGEIRWTAFPVEIEADAAILSDSDAYDDLTHVMDFWEKHAGKPLFTLKGPWDGTSPPYNGLAADPDSILENVIYLQNPWPFDSSVKGKTIVHSDASSIERAIIFLRSDNNYCSGNCLGDATTISRRKLIAHELGHFLGLGHSGSTRDLMYPEILTDQPLESLTIDQAMLEKLTK